jgi:ATP/maltotriose-dependent transcriptional regulator MalT
MALPVLRTKIIPPRRRSDLLSRQRLLDLLIDLLDYKLVILAAPAGYGKTSLLIDFADRSDLPVCWYALDVFDRDIQRFLAYFIASIRERFPAFGVGASAALEGVTQADINIPDLVSTIVNEIDAQIPEHFLLVLDDYHLVHESQDVELFINLFIQSAGENCHLVLSSRSLLTLPDLPLFVARSQVGGLSSEELAFDPREIQALVLKNYHVTISDTIAEELVKESEGWITGMLLSAQTVWQGMVDRLRVARVSGVGLYDYLAQQVLDQQPPKVRKFLLRSSFMEELDADLCGMILGDEEDWGSIIDTVLQDNLFVIPVGEDGRWVRYHHLFRDFLQSRLELELPEEKAELLRRLGAAYIARADWEKAYATYQNLGDIRNIEKLIREAGPALIKSGRPVTLAMWIDSLPEEFMSTQPELVSLRAVAALLQGEMELGFTMLERAQSEQRAAGDLSGLAATLVRRADAYRFIGSYSESLKDAQEALNLTVGVSGMGSLRAGAERAIGISSYRLGDTNQALERLGSALSAYTILGDQQMIAMVRMELGLAFMTSGNYRKALEHYQQALEHWKKVNNAWKSRPGWTTVF